MISARHIKAWEKFNEELETYRKDFGEEYAYLYEDAYTSRLVKDFKMTETGILTWQEQDAISFKVTNEKEQMLDEDDAREWLKFWRANFRRAKRYNALDAETLDKIQDGEMKDMED